MTLIARMTEEILSSDSSASVPAVPAHGPAVSAYEPRQSPKPVADSLRAPSVTSTAMQDRQPAPASVVGPPNHPSEVQSPAASTAATLDAEVLTSLVNQVLAEQARRHGVDLS
jgi:hypothetical protein